MTALADFGDLMPRAPKATPMAAATPMAGAPRTTMARMAWATCR